MGRKTGRGSQAAGMHGLAAALAEQHGTLPEEEQVDASQELQLLEAVPRTDGAQPYSCQKLKEARLLQKALFSYLGPDRDVSAETLEDQTLSLCRFLKAYIVIDAGFVAPFVTPGAEGPEFGVPSVVYEDTVCDNADELARTACAAIFSTLIYQNVPQEDAESAPEQVAAVFFALAFNSVKTPDMQAAMDAELEGIDLRVDGVSRLTCAEVMWLLLYFRANLNCLSGKVLSALGKSNEQKVTMVRALQDYANMIKLCPEVPLGYYKFSELAMNLNQIKHAGVMLQRGLRTCDELGATLYSSRMRHMLAVCRVMGAPKIQEGGTEAAAGPTSWTMGEVDQLQTRADADQRETLTWLPNHLRMGITGVDNLKSLYQSLLNDKLLEAARKEHGESIHPDTSLPPIQALISTPQPKELPKGALVASASS